jgi:uncharacterized protein (TIGR03118 family)
MKKSKLVRLILPLLLLTTLAATAASGGGGALPNTTTKNRYDWTNLQSDLPGVAIRTDTNLVNPWGIAPSSNGNLWINDNGTGLSTVYKPDGTNAGLVVDTLTANPTGLVANTTSSFKISATAPSLFIFVSEDGIISGWNPSVNATNAVIAVDNSGFGAVYKGATMGTISPAPPAGPNVLYVTNFHANKVEMYDGNFGRLDTGSTFVDGTLPAGYAPFGVAQINGQIFVSYALQNGAAHDDVPGPGNGYVDIYKTNGTFVKRLISNGNLNSPWGLAAGPTPFGHYNGGLYVGNFGDGVINVYNLQTGAFAGNLTNAISGAPLQFDGLWGMLFLGNNLYFTAGLGGEAHGLFGDIVPVQ